MIDRIIDVLIALHICEEVPEMTLDTLPVQRGAFPAAAFADCSAESAA